MLLKEDRDVAHAYCHGCGEIVPVEWVDYGVFPGEHNWSPSCPFDEDHEVDSIEYYHREIGED